MTMPPGADEGPGPVAHKEYQTQRPGEDDPHSLREQLSAIRPLLGMFALLTTTLDESEILRLATSAMPALVPCRVEAVRLDNSWFAEPSSARFDVEKLLGELNALAGRDGGVSGPPSEWAWAFPLVGPSEMAGYVIASSMTSPPEDQRSLLGVLVQDAGVALANARLHARQNAMALELQAINRSLKRSNAAAEQARETAQRSLDIHRRLTEVATGAEGPEGLARVIHHLTGRSVAVEDRHGNLLAWGGPDEPRPYPKQTPANRQRLLDKAIRTDRPVRDRERLLRVARSGKEVFGTIAITDPGSKAGELDEVVLEHGTVVLMLELARRRTVAEVELRLRRDLVEELLAGAHLETIRLRAEACGYDLAESHRVVIVAREDQPRPDGEPLFDAVRRAARDTGLGGLLSARSNGVAVICTGDHPWELFRRAVERELGGLQTCRLGIGGLSAEPADLRRSLAEARLALDLQVSAAGQPGVTAIADLGVYRLFSEISQPDQVEGFVRQWIGSLLEHDERRGGQLVETLTAYLECGGNYDRTAAALSVHRSTLRYRLRRVREVTGLDLSVPDIRFNLQLATRGWTTMEAMRRG